MKKYIGLAAFLFFANCANSDPFESQALSALPQPVSNNAVAFAHDKDGRGTLYSFFGLGSGKTFEDVMSRAFACAEGGDVST